MLTCVCLDVRCVAPAAVTITGIIWMRYSLAIVPVNYNLFAVNAAMAVTGSYQLSRKIQADYGMGISA